MFSYNCPWCQVTVETDKADVKFDRKTHAKNSVAKREYLKKLAKRKEADNEFYKKRLKAQTAYESYREEYENYDSGDWLDRILGIHRRYKGTFDDYMNKKHSFVWGEYRQLEYSFPSPYSLPFEPSYEKTHYYECEFCSSRIYIAELLLTNQ